jgi:hypothetical protein
LRRIASDVLLAASCDLRLPELTLARLHISPTSSPAEWESGWKMGARSKSDLATFSPPRPVMTHGQSATSRVWPWTSAGSGSTPSEVDETPAGELTHPHGGSNPARPSAWSHRRETHNLVHKRHALRVKRDSDPLCRASKKGRRGENRRAAASALLRSYCRLVLLVQACGESSGHCVWMNDFLR